MLHRSHLDKVNWLFMLVALLGGIGQALAQSYAYVASDTSSTSSYVAQYRINLDGTLTPLTPATTLPTNANFPSSLAVTPNGRYVYAANDAGTVSAYSVNSNGALTELTLLGSPFAAGTGPHSVAVTPDGKFAYVANENIPGSGSVSAYKIDPNGKLEAVAGSPFAAGTEPLSVTVSPNGKFAYVANDGGGTFNGTVSAYRIEPTGALTPVAGSPFPAELQPFWVTVSPNGKFAYVANWGSDSVSAYTIDAASGALTQIAAPVSAGSQPISIAVAPSGRFAYVADYSDGVWVFSINACTGALGLVQWSVPAGGAPRSITVTSDGLFAYVAGQAGDVWAFQIWSNGTLTPIGSVSAGVSAWSVITVDSAATYSVTYAGNGNNPGTAVPVDPNNPYQPGAAVTVLGNIGSPPGVNPLVKSGYVFVGWNTVECGGGTSYAAGDQFNMPSDDVTLYAQWAACTPPPSGMVGWWPGDGNASNIAGGNDGVLNGSVAFPQGMVGPAFDFAAQGDFVEVPTPSGLDFGPAGSGGDLSIDAWIETSSGAQVLPIVDKRDLPGGSSGSQATGYTLFLYNGRLAFQLGDGTFYNYISSGPDLRDGHFHYVAVTVDRSSPTGGTLYVGNAAGTLVPVLTFDPMNRPGSLTNSKPLFIGRHATAPTINFIGLIDEVEIFSRALAQSEIQDIFNAGSAGKCKPTCTAPPTGMVAWYPLDETVGQTAIHDIWTNGLNGASLNASGSPAPVSSGGPLSIVGQYVNNSLYFPNGPYAQVPNDSHFNFFASGTGELSIDAWVRVLGSGGPDPNHFLSPIVDKTAPAGGTASSLAGYSLLIDYPPNLGVAQLAFVLGDGLSAVTSPTVVQPVPLSSGWHHVAVTVARPTANQAPADVALYVDGQAQPGGPAPVQVGNTDNSAALWIGKSRLDSLWHTGLEEIAIDEVEIFNRALQPQEIQSIFNAGSAGKCKCLLVSDDKINCNRSGTFTYTFTVTNFSTSTASGVSFSPPAGSGLTITPGSITTPLPPGVPTTFTVAISGSGAASGDNACFDIALTGQGAVICAADHCVRLPKCPFPIDPIQLPGPAPIVGHE